MGPIGVQEMIVIFLVALVLFGPKKLPELGKNLAKAMGEFRRAQNELKSTFDRHMQDLERETAGLRDEVHKTTAELTRYSDDLADSSNGTYGSSQSSNQITGAESATHPSTVGASEVSSAELHAAQLHASYPTLDSVANEASLEVSQGFVDPPEPVTLTSSEGTVARGALPKSTEAESPEANPLPEFGHTAEAGAKSEFPSLV